MWLRSYWWWGCSRMRLMNIWRNYFNPRAAIQSGAMFFQFVIVTLGWGSNRIKRRHANEGKYILFSLICMPYRPQRWSNFELDGMVNGFCPSTIVFDGFSMVFVQLYHCHWMNGFAAHHRHRWNGQWFLNKWNDGQQWFWKRASAKKMCIATET